MTMTSSGTAVCNLAKGELTQTVTVTATYSGSTAYQLSSGTKKQKVS